MATKRLKPQWFHILLALADGERHGQGIMAEVLRETEGTMKLWPTSLYGSLRQMEEQGLLRAGAQTADGDRRRFYGLTNGGREALGTELRYLQRTLESAARKKAFES